MAWKEAKEASSQLQEYIQECAKAVDNLERDNILPLFIHLQNLFANIISAKGGTITGQPSLDQYFDALKGATNCFSDEQAAAFKGTVIAAKKMMAADENVKFSVEQKQALLQVTNGVNEQCKAKFFKGWGGKWNNNNNGGGNGKVYTSEGTWIAQSCFRKDPNLAEKLFKRYCNENNLDLSFNESGEYPQCKVEVVLNGQVVATGKGKGPWGAKVWAMKEAYFWCRKNVKDNHT